MRRGRRERGKRGREDGGGVDYYCSCRWEEERECIGRGGKMGKGFEKVEGKREGRRRRR